MAVTALVKPDLIQWAVRRSRLPEVTLTKRFPKIDRWQSGEQSPTMKQLEEFAAYTLTPLGYLFLETPPTESIGITDFRTPRDAKTSCPSPELLETVQAMQQRQDWMRNHLKEIGHSPLDYVGSARTTTNVVKLAKQIRETMGLDVLWSNECKDWEDAFRALRLAVEKIGILVMSNSIAGLNTHRKLDPDEFRGFVLIDEYAPLVFINTNDAKSAQMFTLAHEIVHVFVGNDGLFNLIHTISDHNERERFCNRVAAELLVSESEIHAIWDEVKHDRQPFRLLAKRFKVSPIVIARRAFDLDLIAKQRFFAFYQSEQEEWEKRKVVQKAKSSAGPSFYIVHHSRLGQRFSTAVVEAVRNGSLLYRDAFQLTDMHGSTFNQYAKQLKESMVE